MHVYVFIHTCESSGSESVGRSVVSDSCDTMDTRLLCPWNSSSKNAGVGGHSFFQGNFLTQRSSMYIEKEICYKELAHAIMENSKPLSL